MNDRLATFWAGGLLLGVDVTLVQEVIPVQVITPVPLAAAGVLGLLNLRGQLVTALDARHLLGLPERAAGENVAHFIIRIDDEAISLVVDRPGEVVEADRSAYEEVPELVDETIRTLVSGAYKLDDALLLVLDAERAVAVTSG